MVAMTHDSYRSQRGISLIEVLIAMVILAIGLLGLVGLQGRLHVTQVESYQRAQALILLQDMTNRIALNRTDALSYVTAEPIGTGMAGGCPVANATRVRAGRARVVRVPDRRRRNAGRGAGRCDGGRARVRRGNRHRRIPDHRDLAGNGARSAGCSGTPTVSRAVRASTTGPTGSPCVDDLCRRFVTTVVRISDLTPL